MAKFEKKAYLGLVFWMFALFTGSSLMFSSPASAATVYAKDYGFTAADATSALQSAINSGATTVIVSNMGSNWIVKPISLASNQTIQFESGVVVEAMPGQFHGVNDCLFTADHKSNITLTGNGAILKMHREDYTNSATYTYSQWRHVFYFLSCANVNIDNMTMRDSGGDGLFIGSFSGQTPCTNFHVTNISCDNNYRQGVSITNANGVLLENSLMENTIGQEPQAGIDFEPDDATMQLVNLTVNNCRFVNNNKASVLIYPQQLNSSAPNLSITFNNCYLTSAAGWGIQISPLFNNGPLGVIAFNDCTIENCMGPGLYMAGKAAYRAQVQFTRCTWRNVAQAAINGFPANPLLVTGDNPSQAPEFGGILFTDTAIYDNGSRPFLTALVPGGSQGLANIKGNVFVINPKGATTNYGTGAHDISLQISTTAPTATKTSTPTFTVTKTFTRTFTTTPTFTLTRTSTSTTTWTPTFTATSTRTPAFTATAVTTAVTPVSTDTAVSTSTPVSTSTAVTTQTPVYTATAISTNTAVLTSTPVPFTPTATFTRTAVPAATPTATPTLPSAGGTVYAKDYGYNTTDATAALQKAILSGAKTVVISNMGSDWIIQPITLASNQQIICDAGVVISAKPGAFLGLNDCLFTGDHITNVTFSGNNAILRMCKTDYLSAAYPASQWRHVFYLMSCSNITIQNLTARDSGGDGVFIGSFPGQAPCSTITIQSVICDNNARQGMSITNADNLTIDSCQIKNSSGVDPQAGIDFEPDASSQQITRCLVNNCQFVNNAKAGIMVSLQNLVAGTSKDVALSFVGCTVTSAAGWGIQFKSVSGTNGGSGYVEFQNCLIQDVQGPGLYMNSKASYRIPVYFRQCLWRRVAKAAVGGLPVYPMILADDSSTQTPEFGGITFDNSQLDDNLFNRPFLKASAPAASRGCANIKGNLTLWAASGTNMDLGPKSHDISLTVANSLNPATGRVYAMDVNGTPSVSSTCVPENKVVAYPNPSADKVSFLLAIAEPQTVRVRLFNPAGVLVRQVQTSLPAGSNTMTCDVSGLASGVYIYMLNTNKNTIKGKISVVKY